MNLIDWAQLKKRTRLFNLFKKQGIAFYLYRNDAVCANESKPHAEKTTITRSENWHAIIPGNSVEVPISDLDFLGEYYASDIQCY